MNSQTRIALEHLEAAEWFHTVGQQDTDVALVLSSWDAAIANCTKLDWENLCLERANEYRVKLQHLSKERFNNWNLIVRDVKLITIPLVKTKVERLKLQLPKLFTDTVQWDILHFAMEHEYADLYPPGFYNQLGDWYMRGHFPCGRQGDFPEGRLIIY